MIKLEFTEEQLEVIRDILHMCIVQNSNFKFCVEDIKGNLLLRNRKMEFSFVEKDEIRFLNNKIEHALKCYEEKENPTLTKEDIIKLKKLINNGQS